MKKISGFITINIVFLYFMLLSLNASAWTPPLDTPLGGGLHPRFLFIPDSYRVSHPEAPGYTVQEMRQKLISHEDYKTEFQSFIATVDGYYSTVPSAKSKLYVTYDAISFAFIYMLDPSIMSQSPYNFSFAHSKAEYGAKALDHAEYIATEAKGITSFSKDSWNDYITYDYGGFPNGEGLTNVSLAIVSDWLNGIIPLSTKQLIVDAIDNIYELRWDIEVFASSHHFGVAQNGAGILGLYGDTSLSSVYADKIDKMMATLYDDWILSFDNLSDLLLEKGSNSLEGNLYNSIMVANMAPMINILSTALNDNLVQNNCYWDNLIYYKLFEFTPMAVDDYRRVLPTDDTGTSETINNNWGKWDIWWNTAISNSPAGEASVGKWLKETYYQYRDGDRSRYIAVLYNFFNGHKNVKASPPSSLGIPLSRDVGMGQYMMRTGFENDSDSLVAFFAPQYHQLDGGHAHKDFASFRIFKYGDLAKTRQIAKYYTSNKMITQESMFYNTIGVLKPGELTDGYNIMGYRGGYDSSARYVADAAYQTDGSNYVGTVMNEDLEGVTYDYIDYNYSNSWDPSKIDYAEREFLYLRPEGGENDEYVVVFDRINSTDSTNKKFWLLHAAFEPKLLDNNGDEIAMTLENYPEDPDATGGRWSNKTSTPTADNIIEITNTYDVSHARMYNKTLLPSSFQINKVGGPNHYWEDAEGKAIETPSTLTDSQKWQFGAYTMQVQSTSGLNFDIFLNVIQFGDSKTLNQMTAIEKIEATSMNGNMTGTIIKDNIKNRVVLFNPSKRINNDYITPPIYYNISTNAPSRHIITNITPNSTCLIKRNGVTLSILVASSGGVIMFEDIIYGDNINYSIENTTSSTINILKINVD
jgi:hypothetical protein